MSQQDDTLRMAAEIVDKWSGPLHAMNKSLRSLAETAKGTHVTQTAHVRDQAKAYAGLDQSVKQIADRTKSMLTPALAAAGVSILSVGGAVAALVKATNSFGETTKKLAFIGRETGFSITKLRELDALASRVGTSPEAMRAGEQAFAHNMEQLRRWRGASAEFFTSQHDLNVRALGDTLRLSRSNEEAFDAVEDFLDKVPDMVQKMNLLKAVGLSTELANLSGPERRKALAEIRDDLGDAGKNAVKLGLAFQHARDRLDTTLSGTSDMIGAALAEPFTRATDAVREFIKANRGELMPVLHDLGDALTGLDWKDFGTGLSDFFKSTLTDINNIVKGLRILDEWTAHPGKLGAAIGDKAEQAAGYINNLTGQPSTFKQRGAGIPGFASGGIVRSPTLARVGEAGPEAIVPLAGGDDVLKRPIKEGTEAGTRKGVFDGMRDWFDYQRGGGAGGGGGGGGGLSGPHGGAGDRTGLQGPRVGEDAKAAAASFADRFKGEPAGGGSEYLRGERSWIKDELDKDPKLRSFLGGVLAHEQSPGERSKVMESLANRMNYLKATKFPNLTMRDYLRGKYGQFYGPIQRGEISPGLEALAKRQGVDKDIDKVLGGSNDIRGMTDQGSRGDPNFGVGETIMSHGEGYNDFGRGAARAWRLRQQSRVNAPTPTASALTAAGLLEHAKKYGPGTFNDRWHGDLLQQGRRSGLIGGPMRHEVTGSAGVTVDFRNMPRGVLTAGSIEGMFKKITLNRGVAMPLASDGA